MAIMLNSAEALENWGNWWDAERDPRTSLNIKMQSWARNIKPRYPGEHRQIHPHNPDIALQTDRIVAMIGSDGDSVGRMYRDILIVTYMLRHSVQVRERPEALKRMGHSLTGRSLDRFVGQATGAFYTEWKYYTTLLAEAREVEKAKRRINALSIRQARR